MTPPADLAPLRALVEAVKAIQDGAPSGYQYFEASAFFDDLKMLFRVLPAAREALERVEAAIALIDDDKRELIDDIKRGRERAGAHIARLEEALGPDAAGAPLADLLRDAARMAYQYGGGPLEDRLTRKADQVSAALEGRDE